MEEHGLLRKTGKKRRSNAGNLEPVYVITEVGYWLSETGLIREFGGYLKSRRTMKRDEYVYTGKV